MATKLRYNGHSRQTVTIEVRAGINVMTKEVSLGEIERVGDADVSDTLARAMESGQWEIVPAKSYARGVRPRNYAAKF